MILWLFACAAESPALDCAGGAAAEVEGVGYAGVAEAVAAAPEGGRVDVCAGTWPANLVIERAVSIVGDGAVLDGGGAGSVVWVRADVTVSGVTITGGSGTEGELTPIFPSPGGGAVLLERGNLALEAVEITGNTANGGGAVHVRSDTRLEATDVRFEGNQAAYEGGAVFVERATFQCHACVFEDDRAAVGGAVSAYFSDVTLDEGTTVRANVAERGGGLSLYGAAAVFQDVTIEGNVALGTGGWVGGGGLSVGWSTIEAEDTVVTDNEADFGGGIANVLDGTSISGAMVTGNRARLGGGIASGSAWFDHGDYLTLRDVSLLDNVADEGGGLYVWITDPPTWVEGGRFEGNVATAGGGAYIEPRSDVTFAGVSFVGNSPEDVAADGGPYDLGEDADLACGAGGCE